ncbi:hypothetical protein PHLGIDRAFT_119016 [Phlebiopsis gigantea 11061_1 CR5-6]|uniref:Uncharacterized protein n=1 Tax=Phlebiopsis gigantea (strain 11061_1 CR5-6) TaxID=745531 RepID=A0A0C3RX87_PHLG1|nr:hypothetical protein PHLGIDRAFT_119016 [Phlebiopsis gigantea 11061_1 CR5-6]
MPSVQFRVNGTLGVRLRDALRYPTTHNIQGLYDPNALPILSHTSLRVTIRIQWPGYESWTDPNGIHQYDHGYEANLRNRQHIAWQVARSVKTFYDEMRTTQGIEPGWSLGRMATSIAFDDLYLIELRNASRGSWQPVLSWLPANANGTL